jgi:hypothetical protein
MYRRVLDGDYHTIQVIDGDLNQVAEFRNNEISPNVFYSVIKAVCNYFMNQGCYDTYWSFENNAVGAAIGSLYINDEHPTEAMLVSPDPKNYGCVTSGKNKIVSCLQLKNMIEKSRNYLNIRSKNLIVELKNYVSTGGSYAAKVGSTDDLISALLIVIQMMKYMGAETTAIQDALYGTEDVQINVGDDDGSDSPMVIMF